MKEALTRVFQYYGPILDVIAKSSLKRKGQAFVVFDSEKSALDAVEEMNGFELYGKAMKVSRAKTHSDETVKRKAADMFEEHKRKRLMLKGTFLCFVEKCVLVLGRSVYMYWGEVCTRIGREVVYMHWKRSGVHALEEKWCTCIGREVVYMHWKRSGVHALERSIYID
jgi:hypothetical protein